MKVEYSWYDHKKQLPVSTNLCNQREVAWGHMASIHVETVFLGVWDADSVLVKACA